MTQPTRTTQLDADWLTPKQAGSYLGISAQVVRRWVSEGRIDGRKIGYHTIRISAASISAFLDAKKKVATNEEK